MFAVMALKLIVSAFPEGGMIPPKYTCNGENVSPAIEWSGAPPNAKSFALILDDPDAPGGLFTHWLLWNIPASSHSLSENFKASGHEAAGENDFDKRGYGGPCPPSGTHRYYLRLYALDTPSVSLKPGARRADADRAIRGHIVEKAEYMGKYSKK